MKTLQERVHSAPKPVGWKLDKLHRVLRVRQGYKNVGMVENNLLSLSYGRIKRKDIDGAGGLLPESFETYQIVEPGNIVMRLTDLQNDKRSIRQGLVIERGIITSAYDALEATKGNEPRFWAYVLLALDLAKYYYSLGGGVRQSINFGDFPNDWVYLPDLASQKRIADFLDTETARVDALIEKKQRLIEVINERRSAFLDNYFAMEKNARWLPMRRLISRIEQGWSPDCEVRLAEEGEWGVLKVGCVNGWSFNSCEHKALPPDLCPKPELEVRDGDLLMSRANTPDLVGSTAIVSGGQKRLMLCDKLYRIHFEPKMMRPEFALLALRSKLAKDHFASRSNGASSSMQNISQETVRSLVLPVPSLADQVSLVSEFSRVSNWAGSTADAVSASIARLSEYRAALITAAVTGQIDVAAHARPVKTVLRLAGADVVPLQPSPQPTSLPDRRTVRVLVAAEVVHRLGVDPYLGRIKLQKLMFLAEAHANINEIDGCYERYRAGPYDGAMMTEIETGLRQEQFYAATEDATSDRRRITFQRMPRAGDHRDSLSVTLGDRVVSLRCMVDLFKDMNTEATEAVATLYAVWNDALIDGQQLDDAAIIRGFLQEWHKDKDKFRQSDLQHWLGWMHRKGIVPRGAGPRTISTSTPSLFESE